MYMRVLKTALTEALRTTFSEDYDIPQLRNIWTSIEYPIHENEYPGIWINYEDASPVTIAGIAHVENDEQGNKFTRWTFQGYATLTIAAMSSNELDTIYDELIRVIAFSRENERRSSFRRYVETNDLVAINIDFDQIEPRGSGAAPGTPWGTNEVIYERSVALQLIGEFVSDPWTGSIIPLSKVVFEGYYEEDQPGVDPPQFRGEYPLQG